MIYLRYDICSETIIMRFLGGLFRVFTVAAYKAKLIDPCGGVLSGDNSRKFRCGYGSHNSHWLGISS